MAKSASIILDIFAIVMLLIVFSYSIGMANPIGQVLIKSQTFTTITHYQVVETYSFMGQTYKTKVPIPAGYTLELYDNKYNGPEKGTAYLLATEVPNAKPIRIGNYNYESKIGNRHKSIRGPGWIIIQAGPLGNDVIDYKEGSSSATLIKEKSGKMPFQDNLVGLGKALSELTTKIYSEGY